MFVWWLEICFNNIFNSKTFYFTATKKRITTSAWCFRCSISLLIGSIHPTVTTRMTSLWGSGGSAPKRMDPGVVVLKPCKIKLGHGHEKNLTFQCLCLFNRDPGSSDWLIILFIYYIPYIIGQYNPLYTLHNHVFFHCSNEMKGWHQHQKSMDDIFDVPHRLAPSRNQWRYFHKMHVVRWSTLHIALRFIQ